MEVNAQNMEALRTGFSTIFNTHFEAVETTWQNVAMEVPSSTSENVYRWLGKLKGMQEWVGERVVQSLVKHGYTVVNRSFENTVGVDRDDIEDDNIGTYNPLFGDLGQTAAEMPDELVWEVVENGFTETCFDGQSFFDTDHPVLDKDGVEASYSNLTAGAGAAWFLLDTRKVIKPFIYQLRRRNQFVSLDRPDDPNVFMRKEFLYGNDMRCTAAYGLPHLAHASKADLTIDDYAAARSAMGSLKGAHGRKLNIMPNLLVVPPSLEKKAREVLIAQRQADGADNVYHNTAKLHVEPRLAA